MQTRLNTYKMCKYFQMHTLCGCSISIYAKVVLFFFLASNLRLKGHSHVGSLFTNEEQKKAGS